MSSCALTRLAFVVGSVAVAAWAGTLTAQPPAAQDSDKLLAEVKAAWKKREETVRTLKATWACKSTTPKGSLTDLGVLPPLPDGKVASRDTVFPPKDWVLDGSGELMLDGKKTRIVNQLPVWDYRQNDFVAHRRECTFDGKLFSQLDHSDPGHPQAVVQKAKSNQNLTDMMLVPLMASVRGLDRDLVSQDTNLDGYTDARRVLINNRPLVQLTRPRNETRGECTMWVDPAQDFALVRREGYNRDGKLTMKITVIQSAVSGAGWLPERWTSSMFRPDGKLSAQNEVITKTREVNLATTDSDFQLQLRLPTGAIVSDASGSETREYILRDEGKKRDILPAERFSTYEDLVRTETGDLDPNPRPHRWWRWVLIGAGTLVGVVSLGFLVRRYLTHRRSASTTGPDTL